MDIKEQLQDLFVHLYGYKRFILVDKHETWHISYSVLMKHNIPRCISVRQGESHSSLPVYKVSRWIVTSRFPQHPNPIPTSLRLLGFPSLLFTTLLRVAKTLQGIFAFEMLVLKKQIGHELCIKTDLFYQVFNILLYLGLPPNSWPNINLWEEAYSTKFECQLVAGNYTGSYAVRDWQIINTADPCVTYSMFAHHS